jgi:hypothetical protein
VVGFTTGSRGEVPGKKSDKRIIIIIIIIILGTSHIIRKVLQAET